MSDNSIKLKDDHGEFYLDTGTSTPPSPQDYQYEVCGAVLKFTESRYGETRYCEGMACSNFYDEGEGRYSKYCKHHRGHENVEDLHEDNFETGAYSKSYKSLADNMPVHTYAVAIALYKDLRGESVHDFGEATVTEHELDASDVEWFEEDAVTMQFPIGDQKRAQEKALWFAALDFCRIEAMEEKQFEDAIADNTTVGEREAVVAVTDNGQEITDEEEHHLNLPMSRITKDYKRHLEFGGVPIEASDDEDETSSREWHINIGGEETSVSAESAEPEDVPEFDTPN